jgi:triosephosphate isomerase
VWAIGNGQDANPGSPGGARLHRSTLTGDLRGEASTTVRILYGGSVKPDNIDELMAQTDIDGALVGGASLEVASFERILRYKG